MTPIVAITAFATREDAQRSFAAGMDDYMTKPISLDDLRRITDHWLPISDPANQPEDNQFNHGNHDHRQQ
jgi:two-component system, sensor histidine kinase and response regulator